MGFGLMEIRAYSSPRNSGLGLKKGLGSRAVKIGFRALKDRFRA